MKKIIKNILQYFSMIALGIEGLTLAILSWSNSPYFDQVFSALSGAMLVEIVVFLLSQGIDTGAFQDKVQKQINDGFETAKALADKRNIELDETIKAFNNASIEIHTSKEEFYDKLSKSRAAAKKTYSATSLDPCPPHGYENTGERVAFFQNDLAILENNPHLEFRRIVSIPNIDKLNWVKETIENAGKFDNLSIAFIYIPDIEDDKPFPKILSLQIIDTDEVFLLNPRFSYMPNPFEHCIYIKNPEVADIFEDYYNAVWSELVNANREWTRTRDIEVLKKGCILKDKHNIANLDEKLEQIKQLFINEKK